MNERKETSDRECDGRLREMNNRLDQINESLAQLVGEADRIRVEVRRAREEAEKAEKTARSANNNEAIWVIGILLALIFAMISNPSVADHYAFLKNKGFNPDGKAMKDLVKSYLIFSKIDINGEKEGGIVTLGIFGNVFQGEALLPEQLSE